MGLDERAGAEGQPEPASGSPPRGRPTVAKWATLAVLCAIGAPFFVQTVRIVGIRPGPAEWISAALPLLLLAPLVRALDPGPTRVPWPDLAALAVLGALFAAGCSSALTTWVEGLPVFDAAWEGTDKQAVLLLYWVGPVVEEAFKSIILVWALLWLLPDRRDPYAMYVAAIVVAAGFSLVEMLAYFEFYGWSLEFALTRWSGVLYHATYASIVAVLMGLSRTAWREDKRGSAAVLLPAGLVIAVFAHVIGNMMGRSLTGAQIAFAVATLAALFWLSWARARAETPRSG